MKKYLLLLIMSLFIYVCQDPESHKYEKLEGEWEIITKFWFEDYPDDKSENVDTLPFEFNSLYDLKCEYDNDSTVRYQFTGGYGFTNSDDDSLKGHLDIRGPYAIGNGIPGSLDYARSFSFAYEEITDPFIFTKSDTSMGIPLRIEITFNKLYNQ